MNRPVPYPLRFLFQAFLLIAGLFSFNNLHATHLAGGEIEYTCIGPRRWSIKLTVYRYCDFGSAPLCASFSCPQTITATPSPTVSQGGLNPNGCVSNPSSIVTTLQLQLVEDIGKDNILLCGPSVKNTCDNLGQVVPGTYKNSIEKYVFAGELNMNLPSLSVANTCQYWDIGWAYCCRNSTTNIQGEPQFFTQATINIFAGEGSGSICKNSSPRFNSEPIANLCAGKEHNISLLATDPDQDELTYELVKAYQGANQPVSYNAPFNERWPFPLFATLPPHSDYPSPPFLVLDSISGDIRFTPNNNTTQPIGGDVNIRVYQWGYKESPAGSGNMVRYIKGITHRNLQIYSMPCAGNTIPSLETSIQVNNKPKLDWTICEGEQLCFMVKATDADVADTTYLEISSSNLSPDSSVSFLPNYTSPRPREDHYQFCWQTQEGHGRNFPYAFTVKATDRRCPEQGIAMRSFKITVLPKDSAIEQINGTQNPLADIAYEYHVKEIADVQYEWYVTNGTFFGGNKAPVVYVKWNQGPGILSVKQTLRDCIDSVSINVSTTVGLREYDKGFPNLLIKPNPNKGLFTLEGENIKEGKLAVINLLGQTLLEQEVPQNGIIDVRHLAEGVYYLQVSDKKNTAVLKLVIK